MQSLITSFELKIPSEFIVVDVFNSFEILLLPVSNRSDEISATTKPPLLLLFEILSSKSNISNKTQNKLNHPNYYFVLLFESLVAITFIDVQI